MRRASETIAFRADSELLRLLDAAREPFDLSRGDWVRGVVISHLHREKETEVNPQLTDLRESLVQLEGELAGIRRILGRMLFATLTAVGNVQPDEAKTIVRKVSEVQHGGHD